MDVIYLPVEGVVCRTMSNLVPDIIHSCSVFLHPNLLSVQPETRGEITDCLTESCSGLNSPVPRFNEELWIYISLSFHDPVSSPRSHRRDNIAHFPPLFQHFLFSFGFFHPRFICCLVLHPRPSIHPLLQLVLIWCAISY